MRSLVSIGLLFGLLYVLWAAPASAQGFPLNPALMTVAPGEAFGQAAAQWNLSHPYDYSYDPNYSHNWNYGRLYPPSIGPDYLPYTVSPTPVQFYSY